MIQGTLLKVMAGVIAVLAIATFGAGWMLKNAWQDNATLEANALQYQETINGMATDFKKLEKEKAISEVIVVDNARRKEPITKTQEKIKYVIREVQKNAPIEDCLNQPMPDAIFECLSEGSCDRETGEGASLPASRVN